MKWVSTKVAGPPAYNPPPAAFAPAVADALPHGVLEEHPELGHFGPLQDPAAMAASISAALG